jgi:hypothetical protein
MSCQNEDKGDDGGDKTMMMRQMIWMIHLRKIRHYHMLLNLRRMLRIRHP